MDKPQMIEHLQQSVNYTVFDCKWIPSSAKFLVLGSKPNSTGIIEMYELNGPKLDKIKDIEKKHAIKCGTFGASNLRTRHIAIGDFGGFLQVIDLERPDVTIYKATAHLPMVNAIDGIGGQQFQCGAPEIVTGGRGGAVKVWDIRQADVPVVNMTPEPSGDSVKIARDCWAVAFGDSHTNEERCVVAGYDNGDLILFDLRNLSVRWETSLANGVCSAEFDRKDIPMNKLVVTTLEGGLIVYDMWTQHDTKGFAYVEERNAGRSVGSHGVISGPKSTVWLVRHLPQNRDLFVTGGGSGSLRLWQYEYPGNRKTQLQDGSSAGVAGSLNMLHASTLSSQPVHCFDWHPDKIGLGLCGSFDQCVRVLVTTNPY